MPTTYYLDTTIPLTRLFAPMAIRQRIDEQIETQNCLISRYVRMEYLRWLAPAVDLHRLLQQEIQRNPATALGETQARILLSFGRNQTKMLSLLTLLSRSYGHKIAQYMLQLEALIEYEFENLLAKDITELPDPIACPLMSVHAVPDLTSYRLEPDIPYRRGQMPCHIVDFLQEHHAALQELASALQATHPKLAEACRHVLAKPAHAQGNLCKTLGDVIIALQTPADAVLWTTDAAFDLICPTLGIPYQREPLSG